MTSGYRPYIGGIEVFLAKLGPALVERGHEVGVLTSHGYMDLPDSETIDGVRIERAPFTEALVAEDPRMVLAGIRRSAAFLRDFAPDLVHLHFSDAVVFFYLRSAAAHPAPLVITFHLSPPPEVHDAHGALREALGRAARITAVSQATLDDVLAHATGGGELASVIPSGVDPPPGDPTPPPEDPPVVGAAGRLVPEKGFDILVDAVPELRERVPGVRVRIGGDGPEREALAARAERLGVADSVELPGWLEPGEINAFFGRASVAAVPSRWQEPFAITALQAKMAGRALVASRVGGLPEMIEDGRTGLLVEPEDAGALTGALAELLLDPGRGAAMGLAARERAVRLFGFERSLGEFERVYAEALG